MSQVEGLDEDFDSIFGLSASDFRFSTRSSSRPSSASAISPPIIPGTMPNLASASETRMVCPTYFGVFGRSLFLHQFLTHELQPIGGHVPSQLGLDLR